MDDENISCIRSGYGSRVYHFVGLGLGVGMGMGLLRRSLNRAVQRPRF
jgi:hypothetical protein